MRGACVDARRRSNRKLESCNVDGWDCFALSQPSADRARNDVDITYFYFRVLCLILTVLFISGCATSHKRGTPSAAPSAPAAVTPSVEQKTQGVYHKVSKQESLWRIAKTYGVTLDDIVKANRIPNAAVIEENQLILIPGASDVKKVMLEKPEGKPDEFFWPLRGRIVSYFNDAKGQHVNRGIDIAAAEGEEIRAARNGKVVFADYLNGYGYTVIVDHLDGFYSVYAHQSDVMVKPDEMIARGVPIGRLAKSGRLAFLHFEVRKFDEPNNPLYYLP